MLVDNLGTFLYKKNVIGQVTAEFVVFEQFGDNLFWAIDLKYGITDYSTSFNFAEFMESQADRIMEDSLVQRTFTNSEIDAFSFCCPILTDNAISELTMRSLVDAFRNSVVV